MAKAQVQEADCQSGRSLAASLADARAFYPEIGVGNYRAVFLLPDGEHVLKVPLNDDGMIANGTEANWTGDFIPIAWCRLVEDRHGVPLLVMERVALTFDDDLPEWTGWVDCAQVGYTNDGRLVAYDV